MDEMTGGRLVYPLASLEDTLKYSPFYSEITVGVLNNINSVDL